MAFIKSITSRLLCNNALICLSKLLAKNVFQLCINNIIAITITKLIAHYGNLKMLLSVRGNLNLLMEVINYGEIVLPSLFK